MHCDIWIQKWSKKKQDLEHVAADALKLKRQKIVRSELQQKRHLAGVILSQAFA